MSDKPDKPNHKPPTEVPVAPSIGELLGVSPILPGESKQSYLAGLGAVIEELDAKTTLQVYLAEKIYDCLWWIRRYEDQKRVTLIAEMAHQMKQGFSPTLTQKEVDVREALLGDNITAAVIKTIGEAGHSIESLRQLAYSKKRAEVMQLDQQIALHVKILASLQGSYELAFNRKLNIERLMLQNALMRRDLGAIDTAADSPSKKTPTLEGAIGGKPKAARRK